MSFNKIDKHYTEFAPAERISGEELNRQINLFKENVINNVLLNAIPINFTILNSTRQIVFANDSFIKFLGLESDKELLGLRVGEAVNCIHAKELPGGCGTTEFCSTCGAANAILLSLRGNEAAKECRITIETGDALDLMVWGNPMDISGERFSIFSFVDISDTKRRRALERIFFHDVLNTAGTLRSFLELTKETENAGELNEYLNYAREISNSLIDEILEQKDLAAAETGELIVKKDKVKSNELLSTIRNQFSISDKYNDYTIEISPSSANVEITTDRVILRRIIVNLIKNAIEASKKNDIIKVGCNLITEENKIVFWVNNPAVMSKAVKLQIFQRSFSTKGKGRGLGTYSIKLLTERYLKGSVSFTSETGEGTTMYITLPLTLSDPE